MVSLLNKHILLRCVVPPDKTFILTVQIKQIHKWTHSKKIRYLIVLELQIA